MQLLEVLLSDNGGQAIDNLAASYGISREQARRAVEALSPQIADRIERNPLSRGGLADLLRALGDGHHEAYLGGQLPLDDPRVRSDGEAILGHLLGTKDASRGLAQRAASQSGLDAGLLRQLLPVVAGMMMGGLSKQTAGGLAEILSRIGLPGGGMGLPQSDSTPRSGGGVPRGGNSPLPLPGDGSPMRPNPTGGSSLPQGLPGGLPMPTPGGSGGSRGSPVPKPSPRGGMGQSPLPLPGDVPGLPRNPQNPYGDLSDILRRGGFGGSGAPRPSTGPGGNAPSTSGSMLWRIIRSLFGQSLGFGNRGLTGWILQFFVMRLLWPLLRAFFGGILRGGR